MKNNYLVKKLNSENGAALAIALCVILALTALGLIALMSSAANIGMSSKTRRWTEDFYRLDAKAAEYERLIDNELLQAEKDAREYVRNRMDRLKPEELTGDYDDPDVYDMTNSGAQQFFRDYYLIGWTYVDGGIEYEYTLDDYINYPGGPAAISEWYQDEISRDPLRVFTYDIDEITDAYMSDIKNYTSELFDRVYFYMLSLRLEKLVASESVPYGDIVIKNNSSSPFTAGYDMGPGYNNPSDFATDKFNDFTGVPVLTPSREESDVDAIIAKWAAIEPQDDDIGIYVRVNEASLGASADPLDDPKKVHVYISIIKPIYETVLKHIYTPVRGNPVWANALSVQGSILFDDNADVSVIGDVYASGDGGISVGAGANVHIAGNVYTYGNLQIIGDGGSLSVTKNPDESAYIAKNKIYNENGFLFEDFFDDDVLSIEDYAQTGPDGEMPFIFKDALDRKNVYCRDLIAGREGLPVPVRGASLTAAGNIWTSDDIQMEAQDSELTIGNTADETYYVGLNPFSDIRNPNASSAILNNYPFDAAGNRDSRIVINSRFYIPGVAFYQFASGPDPNSGPYYKSLESVASRRTWPAPLIYAYLNEGSGIVYTDESGDEYEVYSIDNEAVRRAAFTDFVNDLGGIRTNVLTDLPTSSVDGYAAEVAPIQHRLPAGGETDATLYTSSPGDFEDEYELPHSTQNSTAFSKFTTGGNNYLMDIFEAKTLKLGTNEPDGRFMYFIDDTVTPGPYELIDRTAAGTLDLQYYNEGIVYCDGDLTIMDSNPGSGTKTFRGVIICTGDVTVRNGVTIIYDEQKILERLKYSSDLRRFFEKGSRGLKVTDCIEYSTSSGTRTIPKRYRIREWSEVTA